MDQSMNGSINGSINQSMNPSHGQGVQGYYTSFGVYYIIAGFVGQK